MNSRHVLLVRAKKHYYFSRTLVVSIFHIFPLSSMSQKNSSRSEGHNVFTSRSILLRVILPSYSFKLRIIFQVECRSYFSQNNKQQKRRTDERKKRGNANVSVYLNTIETKRTNKQQEESQRK